EKRPRQDPKADRVMTDRSDPIISVGHLRSGYRRDASQMFVKFLDFSRSAPRRCPGQAGESPADRVHESFRLDESRCVDLVAFPLGGDAVTDRLADRLIACAASKEAPDVRLLQCEQAVSQLAIGGEPEAVAAHAERTADRGDEADPSPSVGVG